MWGQKEQQEHSQHGLYLLTHIHQTLQELIKVSKGDDREAQREIITLSDSAYPYAANGYRYNGVFAAGGESVTVAYRGFGYSQVLQAGWNQLNLPDGCEVSTAGNAFMVELVRDNEQYAPAVDVISGTVTGTVTSTLAGHLVPLQSITPKLIATIPYSEFTTASSNINPYWESVLTRSARARTFMVYNGMNEALTMANFGLYDSILAIAGTPNISETGNLGFAPGPGAVSVGTSEEGSVNSQGIFASHVDSLQAILGIGATLPTSGNVQIWASELL